ncbi:hypothetical protein RDWZM_006352 [Blomia tropicalis]|uniref:Uncharacterized protein n=1 Tax=Blomia tropicalis TaxID=40697 RepID=A0A9Q0RNG8_BLOTA|nr:hypothetical protein RDWZM_006352 [Blomia tropicalis]
MSAETKFSKYQELSEQEALQIALIESAACAGIDLNNTNDQTNVSLSSSVGSESIEQDLNEEEEEDDCQKSTMVHLNGYSRPKVSNVKRDINNNSQRRSSINNKKSSTVNGSNTNKNTKKESSTKMNKKTDDGDMKKKIQKTYVSFRKHASNTGISSTPKNVQLFSPTKEETEKRYQSEMNGFNIVRNKDKAVHARDFITFVIQTDARALYRDTLIVNFPRVYDRKTMDILEYTSENIQERCATVNLFDSNSVLTFKLDENNHEKEKYSERKNTKMTMNGNQKSKIVCSPQKQQSDKGLCQVSNTNRRQNLIETQKISKPDIVDVSSDDNKNSDEDDDDKQNSDEEASSSSVYDSEYEIEPKILRNGSIVRKRKKRRVIVLKGKREKRKPSCNQQPVSTREQRERKSKPTTLFDLQIFSDSEKYDEANEQFIKSSKNVDPINTSTKSSLAIASKTRSQSLTNGTSLPSIPIATMVRSRRSSNSKKISERETVHKNAREKMKDKNFLNDVDAKISRVNLSHQISRSKRKQRVDHYRTSNVTKHQRTHMLNGVTSNRTPNRVNGTNGTHATSHNNDFSPRRTRSDNLRTRGSKQMYKQRNSQALFHGQYDGTTTTNTMITGGSSVHTADVSTSVPS